MQPFQLYISVYKIAVETKISACDQSGVCESDMKGYHQLRVGLYCNKMLDHR